MNKKQYTQGLRDIWKDRKALADQDTDARARFNAILASADTKFSYYGYYFTLCDMRAQKIDGNPYVDVKTFNGWKANGFKVKKGEKSTLSGITWIHPTSKDKTTGKVEDDFLYPKAYHLFHRGQVENN